jgi:hypothetical protein
MSEEIILESNDNAAKIKTITGWVSSNGRFFGKNEQAARYDGATHKKCPCGAIIPITTYCGICHQKRQKEKYNAMPFKEWDGDTPICTFDNDIFFYCHDGVREHCEENDIRPKDLELVICSPVSPSEIDESHFDDDLAEDHNLSDVASNELIDALDKINKIIRDHDPFCWMPGEYRTTVEVDL